MPLVLKECEIKGAYEYKWWSNPNQFLEKSIVNETIDINSPHI